MNDYVSAEHLTPGQWELECTYAQFGWEDRNPMPAPEV